MLVIVPLVWAFTNCSKSKFEEKPDTKTRSSMSGGNGDSYAGKPEFFLQFGPEACTQLSREGNPFPNRQIFRTGSEFTLVRDNCADITPKVLTADQYSYDAATELVVYEGQIFNLRQDLSEFNLIPNVCPAGLNLTSNNPPNTFQAALELLSPSWFLHDGLSVLLDGSISALPRYRIERQGPALDYWKRLSQFTAMTPNTAYAFTMLFEPGSKSQVSVNFYNDDATNFSIMVDLTNGTSSIHHQVGVPQVSARTDVYGAGVAVTVYFTTGALPQATSDLGVAPYDPVAQNVGDYIYSTAARLNTVDSFCGLP